MQLNLDDTLTYDGERFEYADVYFIRGLMNNGIRVYQTDDGSEIHYNPETALKRYVAPDGHSHRLEVAKSPDDGPIQLRDSEHRGY